MALVLFQPLAKECKTSFQKFWVFPCSWPGPERFAGAAEGVWSGIWSREKRKRKGAQGGRTCSWSDVEVGRLSGGLWTGSCTSYVGTNLPRYKDPAGVPAGARGRGEAQLGIEGIWWLEGERE